MNETKTLGQRLYECREKTGMKQADVARALNVQRQQISYYENDSRQPDLDRLKELARLYGVSTDYLLGMTDVSSSDLEIKEVCNYTGLSENAVAVLHCNAAYRKKFGTVPEEIAFDTIEKTTEYPYVNLSLLDATNILIEHGYETMFFEMLLNYIYSNDLELIDGKGQPDYLLRYRNEKLSQYEYHWRFDSEQLEEFAFLMLQHALKDIRNICTPDFEETLLGQRSKGMRMLYKEMQEYQESDTDTEESE